jgi:hypothetical protein
MADQATAAAIDFTNVKDGGGAFNKKRQPEGDYKAKVTKVVDSPSKKDQTMQWLFTIQVGSGTYPYYCKHEENQYWKIRNLLVAAGLTVPKKKVKVDPNKIVGKMIAVTLEDDEYDGKAQSNIAATFPLSELDDDDVPDEDEDEVEDDDEDEDDTPPPAKKKKAPVVEDDEDDEDDEDEEEEAPAPRKKKKAPVVEDDDDLDEIDIDDV